MQNSICRTHNERTKSRRWALYLKTPNHISKISISFKPIDGLTCLYNTCTLPYIHVRIKWKLYKVDKLGNWSKTNWWLPKKMSKLILGLNRFIVEKQFCQKKIFVRNITLGQKYCSKKFWVQNFWFQKTFAKKCAPNDIGSKKCLVRKKFVSKKMLGPKFFCPT